MPKSDLGDVCGRYLSAPLSRPAESCLLNDQQTINVYLEHESSSLANERPALLFDRISSKNQRIHSLEKFNKNISSEKSTDTVMPANNDVLLTTFNNNTSTSTNGTNGNHQYRTSYTSCSNGNGNGNHSLSPTPSSDSSSSPSSSNDSSTLMMNWELLKDRGSGLVNLGNTCFINASLQCLANTPPLVQWILCNSHHQCCRVKLEKQFCLFCEAERIVKTMHSKNGNSSFSSSVTAANPNNIARRIKDISTTFKIGRQEDASEFMICLIDKIVDACLRSSQPPERLRPSSGSSYEQLCHSQTIFHDLFGLVLRSRVDCLRCRHTSDTFEVQYTWIVGVRNHNDVRQSLEQFVGRETLSDENLYRCIKCKQLVRAFKRYTLHKASKVLLINLKRFEFGKNSHKLSHLVRYPEYLDVRPYMSEENANDQSLNYRLYAVLVHVGASMHSGHYFSYVRSPNNRWYKADDTQMTLCDLSQVLAQHGAYILCYIKETPGSSTTNSTSTNTNVSPPNTRATTPKKLYYQNGKSTNGDQSFVPSPNLRPNIFTPRQIPVKNIIKPTNGDNGTLKSPIAQLTKAAIVTSSNTESTNGNGALPNGKREPILMRIPTLSVLHQRTTQSTTESSLKNNTNSTTISSTLVNRPSPASITLSTPKNSNFIISSTTSLSSVQSTSSPLKLIIKTSGPSTMLSGLASISSSYNHNDDDEDESNDENENSSISPEPPAKKARLDESTTSTSSTQSCSSAEGPRVEYSAPVSLVPTVKTSDSLSSVSPVLNNSEKTSNLHPINTEQINTSNSITSKHKKKKKKKKSHKHHHHRHRKSHHRRHHRRSRHDSSRSRSCSRSLSSSRSRSRSRSSSPSGSPSNSSSHHSDEKHRRHRKSRKHHLHKRSASPPSSSSSPSSSASPSTRERL